MSLATAITKARAAIQAGRGVVARHPGATAAAVTGAAGAAGYMAGEGGGERRRRRSRGITSRDFRVTQRTLRKISKMYAKLPRRASHASRRSYGAGKGGQQIISVD
jgi:hypothetical protein